MAKITTGPTPLDWDAYAGDSNRATFEISSNDPIDLTGAVFAAQARETAVDEVIAATAVITPVQLDLGRFTVEWDGEELRSLLAGVDKWVGVWDLQLTAVGDLPRTVCRGVFTVTHDVTRVVTP